MAECTSEGGKLWLAQAIFDRHKYTIRCATCATDARCDRQGFVKDSAGNKTKSGLRHRYWRCQRSQSLSGSGSGCMKLTTTAFLDRARVFISREQYMGAAREAIAFADRKGEGYEGVWLRSALDLLSRQSDVEYRVGRLPLPPPMGSSSPCDESYTTPPSEPQDDIDGESDNTSFETPIDWDALDTASSSPLLPLGKLASAKRKLETIDLTAEEPPKRLRVVTPSPDPIHRLSARVRAVEGLVVRLEGKVVGLEARWVRLDGRTDVEVGTIGPITMTNEKEDGVQLRIKPDVSPSALAKSFLATSDPVQRRRIRTTVLNLNANVEFQEELARSKGSAS